MTQTPPSIEQRFHLLKHYNLIQDPKRQNIQRDQSSVFVIGKDQDSLNMFVQNFPGKKTYVHKGKQPPRQHVLVITIKDLHDNGVLWFRKTCQGSRHTGNRIVVIATVVEMKGLTCLPAYNALSEFISFTMTVQLLADEENKNLLIK